MVTHICQVNIMLYVIKCYVRNVRECANFQKNGTLVTDINHKKPTFKHNKFHNCDYECEVN